MVRSAVERVKLLTVNVKLLCAEVLEVLPKDDTPLIGPDPRVAQLKRQSMDLTRALARLRGRGRF